ncbi:uncharacterized protein N7482_006914 [Penicillium canariense]|uniref:Uncharacterized protein n=1 Tax=Penicillium canariense TaxID=189055 RepID=A0A9W9I0M8_9EURO|nr:uncharacterized protein N7482_006914 [Penicillium canariense]KAJ5159910.1 hypothetical protein N7482_006914 [Penicillium canariense]
MGGPHSQHPCRFPGFDLGSKFDAVVANGAGNTISIEAGDQRLVSRVRDEIGSTVAVFPLGSRSITVHGPRTPSLVDVNHAPFIDRADTRLFITVDLSWDRAIHVVASQFDKIPLFGHADDSGITAHVGVGEVLTGKAATALSEPHGLAVVRRSALNAAVTVIDGGGGWVPMQRALVP